MISKARDMNDYPWYDIVDCEEKLQQGDFVRECPIVIPPEKFEDNQKSTVNTFDVIVMSQSCDLLNNKLEIVLVCPYWPLSKFGEANEVYRGKKGKNDLKQGLKPNLHLLNSCSLSGLAHDFIVVDFRVVFGVHYGFISEFMIKQESRLRLLPPYREHLSQAFARFFMRVGLPSDIPEFK